MILVGRLPAPLAPAPISSPLGSLFVHTGTLAASRSSQAKLHVRQPSKSALIPRELGLRKVIFKDGSSGDPASLSPPLMQS